MKIADIKAAVDRLHTTECRGIVVNSEALKELGELLSTPVIERKDALDAACALLDKVHYQGETDWRIREDIGHFLEQRQELAVERQVEPFGYWMHPNGLPQLGMFHKPDPDIESASVKESFVAVRLFAEQPDIVALREELERSKQQNAELEKDRDAWRRRSTHRLADCQGMMGALKAIERDSTNADSKELATKTIAEILRRAKSHEQPVDI